MDKNELLKRIKAENECHDDPYESELDQKSRAIAGWVMLAVVTVLFFLMLIVWKEYSYELILVAALYYAVADTLRACKMKTPWRIAGAAFWCAIFAVSCWMFIEVYFF